MGLSERTHNDVQSKGGERQVDRLSFEFELDE
jgi:hypothetical protein